MIVRILNPSVPSARFSADRVPETVHGLALWKVMIPIVHSESMAPTLRRGDELELDHADNLRVGDVVLYRYDRLFVCHRIHRIQSSRLFLRGDANAGSFEEVDVGDVVGRVTGLVRRGRRFDIGPYTQATVERAEKDSAWIRAATWSMQSGRSFILRSLNQAAGRSIFKSILRSFLRRLMTIDILKRAPLHSFHGYVTKQRIPLGRLDLLPQCLAALNPDDIVLVVRAGPVYLGTCAFGPWRVHLRPFLRNLTTEVLSESVDVSPASPASPQSVRHAPATIENQ